MEQISLTEEFLLKKTRAVLVQLLDSKDFALGYKQEDLDIVEIFYLDNNRFVNLLDLKFILYKNSGVGIIIEKIFRKLPFNISDFSDLCIKEFTFKNKKPIVNEVYK